MHARGEFTSYSRDESRTSFKRSLWDVRDRAASEPGESAGGCRASVSPAALLVVLRMLLRENPTTWIRALGGCGMSLCARGRNNINLWQRTKGKRARGRPGESFSRLFPPSSIGVGKIRKGVYDDLEDVRDARKNIPPESGSRRSEGSEISIGRYAQRATPEIRCLDAERIGRAN